MKPNLYSERFNLKIMEKSRMPVTVFTVFLLVIALVILWKLFLYKSPQIQFVENMGNGINIGNSLDSYGFLEHHPEASGLESETYWGNPEITKELFVMIKDSGFSTVRIPVTWMDHMDDNGLVDEAWMDRVQTVVDMALSQELYVILNTHHEEWMNLDTGKADEIEEKFAFLWTQIATHFAGYGEKLIFEGMNEPRLRDSEVEWTAGTEELRDMVNSLNRIFVTTARQAGGANKERYLMVCPYATTHVREALENLDVSKGNIIVSVHMYSPYVFCQKEDGITEWETTDSECAEYAKDIRQHFANMKELFIQKGIPVIITEFGCINKDNLDSRLEWLRFYKEQADSVGIPCIWWDDGGDYRIMDRNNYSWTYPEIKDILVN